jgi:glucosyl-dolichyl phosphate glucuronosyltransferase
MTLAELSVIIPTRDRPRLLRDALLSLSRNEHAETLVEAIVVDDGSTRDLSALLREAGQVLSLRCVRQAPAGLTVARNAGAAAARAPLLAYLDDDVLVAPGWALAVVAAFSQWGCDGMAGRIQLDLEGALPGWLSQRRSYLGEFDLGDQPVWLEKEVPYGGNCAVTRDMFIEVGGFRADLGRSGSSLLSNEDTDFFERVRSAGGQLAYWPAAEILHRVPPERLTPAWARRRAHAQGLSEGILMARRPPVRAGTRRLLITREGLRLGRMALVLGRDLLHRRGIVGTQMFVAYCWGRISGLRS